MEAGKNLCKSDNMQSGRRRSRAAAFGDDAIDESVGSTSRVSGQSCPDDQAVSTSSVTTAVCNKGEHYHQTALAPGTLWPEVQILLVTHLPLESSFARAPIAGDE